ncbi:MAG: pyridoxamine 5'-phosphate oxidase family protein [Candidatus Shapirobacteria bacterium]
MDKNKVLEFIKSQTLAVLSTATKQGIIESAVMAIAVTDNWEVLMSSEPNTRKIFNLKNNPYTSLLVGGLQSPSIQLDGTSVVLTDSEGEEIRKQIIAIHPNTAEYLNPPIAYIKFIPNWLRYSDFSQEPPIIHEFII